VSPDLATEPIDAAGRAASGAAFADVIASSAVGAGLAHVIGPLLGALAEVGAFDATYVTAIDWDHRQLQVLHVVNVGDIEVPAGTRFDCPPGLAEQAFLGVTRSNDLPTGQPDSEVARRLGLSSYASVPIITTDHRLFGTLCGASRAARQVTDETVSVMEHFARLIVDQMARDEARRTAQRAGLAEEQLRDRAKFLAEAEHMLKTPLTVLIGFADALDRGGATMPEKDRADAVTAIKRNASLLSGQVNRLLEESMAEVRARDLHPTVIDLRDTIAGTIEAFGQPPEHELRLAATEPVWASADPEVLHQVLAHLLDNAIKYSPMGTTIELALRRDGASAEIDIRDEGIGLPSDIDVFDAFQRGHDAIATDAPGVGLGLHIVRNLTRAMGGTVTAAPNPGPGSTFKLRLPGLPAPRGNEPTTPPRSPQG
jgi:signal transduction histidine kinase